ncbi:MAG TPA: ABC transporter permease [Acidimicrobiales bacterium]|nr:ABC transporter permease [Acidimicrobiales bacterium]
MLATTLPKGSRARSIAVCTAMLLVSILITQLFLPGTGGGGRGTPAAVLFNGFVTGCSTALIALGLVVVYRSLRIINFAQAAIGAAGGRLFFEFMQFTPVPFPIALILGVAVGALTGAAFDLIFGRRFFNQPRIVLTVVTIAALPFLAFYVTSLIPSLPIFPRTSERTLQELEGFVPARPFLPFSGWKYRIGGFPNDYGFPEVFSIELLVFAVIGVVCFLRFTRAGVAIRALAENSERASLLGIPVGSLSTMVWALSGALSTLAVISIGARTVPAAGTSALGTGSGGVILVLLPPITAAVIARFESIPIAVFSSILLATVFNAFLFSYQEHGGLVSLAYFLLLGGMLIFQRRKGGRSEEGTGVSWAAVREQRGIPKELARVGTVFRTRWAFIGVTLIFLLIWPLIVPPRFQFLGATILVQAIIGVSLVILTGWAGQISLGQLGFSAIGAVVGGALTSKAGWPFWIAVPIATVFAGAFATLIGIPALRLKGLFLAVSTLAFAITIEAILFDEKYFDWLLPVSIDRPTLFFINFEQDRPMYYLCLVALVLSIVVALNLRRSRFGRLLIAMRENEANVQSFGVSAVRLKLTAFAVSGAMAGFSGAVYVHQQRGLAKQTFNGQESIDVFVFTVLGGIGSIGGAMLGSLYDNLLTYFLPANDFLAAILAALQQGGGTLLVLYIVPAGLIGAIVSIRDAWLRIIAQRRQIVVPSLFADYDPDALARRLIPLADPQANSGLAALGPGVAFRLSSGIHGGGASGGNLAIAGQAEQERLAISAAVESIGDVDTPLPTDSVDLDLVAVGREEDR